MGERIKPGIVWEPPSLERVTNFLWSEKTQAARFGYEMVLNGDGELKWVELGSILDITRIARKHLQEDPSVFIRVVEIKCAGQRFYSVLPQVSS